MPFTVIPIVNTSPLRESPWSIALSRDSARSTVSRNGSRGKMQFHETSASRYLRTTSGGVAD